MPQLRPDRIEALLLAAVAQGASDVHIVVGHQPLFRVDGQLKEVDNEPVVTPQNAYDLVVSMLSEEQQQKFLHERELDFAYSVKQAARFRVNAHWERGYVGLVARIVNAQPPTMQQLGLVDSVVELTRLHQGLVLVTGPAGEGKSTTIAAIIDEINNNSPRHIITIEDPIEFVYTPNQ